MKILNRKSFLLLPPGSVFTKVGEHYDGFCLKLETINYNETDENEIYGDWFYAQLNDEQPFSFDLRRKEAIESATQFGDGFSMGDGGISINRDGCYDADAMFLVWEDGDKTHLIEILQKTPDQIEQWSRYGK